jgi:putative hydrolase of HD superfamily
MTNSDLKKIFAFLDATSKLKFELRFGDKAEHSKRDSSAAHSWHLSLLAWVIAERLNADGMKLDMLKILKLSTAHDVAEAGAGDVPFDKVFAAGGRDSAVGKEKASREMCAMEKLTAMLPESIGGEMLDIYKDYAAADSVEAKLVNILDKLEAAHQTMFFVLGKELPDIDPAVLHSNRGYGWVPEFDRLIEYVREELRAHFAANGIPWKPEYNLKK